MKIILASSSPRRKDLLGLITKNFEIIVSNAEEKLEPGLTSREEAENISYQKAKIVFDETEGDRIVIGADTMVVKENKIYGKPKTKEKAKQMLEELIDGDRTHTVITGLTVLIQKGKDYKEYKTSDQVKMYFTKITDQEIENWISTGKAYDKAGAYAANEEFAKHIEKIEGNFMTAIGLPIHKLYEIIKEYI
ncbi:MAG: septum formation protein Maf [Clostridia bacterium]|nr:septum formation protein Maf [Clostridia bacterium]